MRIVDDQGMDITWLRSHHPINFHAMKLADPSFEVPIGFRSVVESCEKDGEDVRAFPFELYRDYLVGGDVEDAACNTPFSQHKNFLNNYQSMQTQQRDIT